MYYEFEELKECPYCYSSNLNRMYSAPDRYSNKFGLFFLQKCLNCGLIFQNSRVKEEYIEKFYSDNLGYYQPKKCEYKNFLKIK